MESEKVTSSRKRARSDFAEGLLMYGQASCDGTDFPDGFSPQLQFFRLVRDTIASVPQPLAPAEYVRKQVQIQAEGLGMFSKLPKGTALQQYVRSVLVFMSTSADEHAARTQKALDARSSGGACPPLPPPEPLVRFDEATQSYSWVGDSSMSDDDSLLRLEIMHFERFVSQHGGVYGVGGGRGLHAAPIKSQKAALTLPPGSMEQLAQFQKEERQRYASPDQAYVYSLRNGAKATVSPIAKKSAAVGKAREHFLLSAERPASATLLALVRDAAARLPGREGSRADVCELLKESQYINPGVNDAQISQVASGALDRLHQEQDPCVTYDTERKLWIYLHADRQPSDFQHLPQSKKSKASIL